MKLIREEINEAQYIVEEDNGKKSHKIKGIFMQANIKNRNGRVYPMEVLEKEVNRYNKEFIERKSCLLYTSPSPRDATLSRMPSSA